MKIYKDPISTIVQTQYHDPQLNHLTKKILFHLSKIPGKTILDIGCGVGRVDILAAKKGWKVVGFDVEKKAIAFATAYAKKEGVTHLSTFFKSDEKAFLQTPYAKEKYDVVICSEVIEHVQNPRALVDLAHSVLKKNGTCIFTTPNDPSLWSPMDEYAQHVQRFTLPQLQKLFERFYVRELYTIGYPLMRFIFKMYGVFQRGSDTAYTPASRSSMLNVVYNGVMQVGLQCDDLFNHWRKGTTWIIVAQKK